MSDVTEAAQARRIEELTVENTSLKSENKDRRIRNKAATTELDALKASLAATTTERDTFRTKAEAGPAELNATIADLTSQLAARNHRDAFAAVATFDGTPDDKGVTPKYKLGDGVKIDTVFELLKYKAEGETPSAQIVAKTLGDAQRAHPRLFDTVDLAAGAAARPTTVAARESGPGAGKGTSSATVHAAAGGALVATPGIPEGRI